MDENKLTIFTPTYNRAYKLGDAYESLKNQTNHKFIWLVIDDGSTDDTEQLILEWIKEDIINIEYIKKKNGGKHSAFNVAMENVKTEYVFLALDSDDEMYSPYTIDDIYKELEKVNGEAGIITLCSDSRGGKNNFAKKYNISELGKKTMTEVCSNNLIHAECRMILKTSLIKKYRYPEIEGERFFTESFVWYQFNHSVIWTDTITCFSEYLEDGLTANAIPLFITNPNAWYLYNELRVKLNKSMLMKIKYLIYYIAFGILSGRKILNKGFLNIRIMILYPVGARGAYYLKSKSK